MAERMISADQESNSEIGKVEGKQGIPPLKHLHGALLLHPKTTNNNTAACVLGGMQAGHPITV
eukprot:1157594-Pelagomonas_calceolata.AAC.3